MKQKIVEVKKTIFDQNITIDNNTKCKKTTLPTYVIEL